MLNDVYDFSVKNSSNAYLSSQTVSVLLSHYPIKIHQQNNISLYLGDKSEFICVG